MDRLLESVIVEGLYPVGPDRLWEAITKPDQMRRWFFEAIPAFEPRVGFQTEFLVQANDRDYLHQWKIISASPPEHITYNWKYAQYEGDSEVHFELIPQGNDTMLRVTHKETKPFPRDLPEFTYDSCKGGWEYFLLERLPEFFETG